MYQINVPQQLSLLGYKVRDKITKREGVITSISFDLFGCCQAIINPGIDKDGKQIDSFWFDTNRLEIIEDQKVMDVCAVFEFGDDAEPVATEPAHGPETKPTFY